MNSTEDGRDHEQRRLRMPVAERVKEPVNGRSESAQPHQIKVDDVDAHLDTDGIGWGVTHGACSERIQKGAPTKTEICQFHVT